jgi:prepilin-type N-terminal cleavage/methylation domain-containing protein
MKKGFTLVELLGVIIILSIISLIITPSILDYVNKSKVSAYRTSVQTVMDKAKEYVSQNEENNDFPIGGINILETDLKLEKDNFLNGIIERNTDGEVVAVNVYNGTYCANGTKQNLVVEKASSLEDCESIDATAPELKVRATKITSNKIMVVAIASDSQSGIKDYKYCIGDNCSDYIKTNYYEFTGLKAGQTYEITVSVRNNNTDRDEQYTTDITETELKIKVTTLSIEEPTFEVSSNSYSGSKEVTIKPKQ